MSSSCILLEFVYFMAFSHFIISSGRQCGPPTPPSGSIIIHPLNAHKLNHNNGNVVLFGCKQGLYLVGSPIIKCSGNTWTSTKFKCKGICPDILHIPNGVVIPTTPRLGYSAVEFRCKRSYRLIGRPRLECINGRWNGRLPFCEVAVCPSPAIPKNAYIVHPVGDRLNYTHGTTMFLACREGHYVTGLPMLVCNGTSWSKIEFSCTASCANLGPVDNAVITYVTMEGGGEVQIHCRSNYILVGESNLKCVDGRWNASLPSCKVVECGDPGKPKNGKQVVSKGYVYGGSVTFECDKDYTIKGQNTMYCQANGRWRGSVPECLAPCSDLGYPDQGDRIVEGFRHNQSVAFTCPRGYVMQGAEKIKCSNGRWSASKPSCKDCGLPLGMEDKRIADKQITESYRLIGRSQSNLARLNGQDAWCPSGFSTVRRNAYIQVDFNRKVKITGVSTQGNPRSRDRVTSYSLKYEQSPGELTWYHGNNRRKKVFTGNTNTNEVVRNNFQEPIVTRVLRLVPLSYERWPCLRMELYGCEEK